MKPLPAKGDRVALAKEDHLGGEASIGDELQHAHGMAGALGVVGCVDPKLKGMAARSQIGAEEDRPRIMLTRGSVKKGSESGIPEK